MVHFDPTTGQVYGETSISVRSMVKKWDWTEQTCGGRRKNPRIYRNSGTGSSSLIAMAVRSCVWHIEKFDPETFMHLPWVIAKLIYQKLLANGPLTPLAWSLFYMAYPEEVSHINHVNISPIPPNKLEYYGISSMASYLSRLPLSCLTFLSIRNHHLRVDDFMALLDVPNLAVLHLEQHREAYTEIDDRSLQIWGRAVKEKQAFHQLKVICFQKFRISLHGSLTGLNLFPSLFLANIASWQSPATKVNSQGWQDIHDYSADGRPLIADPEHVMVDEVGTMTSYRLSSLHDIACALLKGPTAVAQRKATVSIAYGFEIKPLRPSEYGTDRHGREWLSHWVVKLPHPSTEDALPKVSAHQLDGEDAGSSGPARKKRKVREKKVKDVGDILGSFR